MGGFTVYPAIDLRRGKVVRLAQGDPDRQTTYGGDPAQTARRWLEAGAAWLHVVNLDGAFEESGGENETALESILEAARAFEGQVQFGGGLRTFEALERALRRGVSRVILGTAAIETPEVVAGAVQKYGAARLALALDASQGQVRVRGWRQNTELTPISLGKTFFARGGRTAIFTDIARDGVGRGVNVETARRLAQSTGLDVIAAGGVASLEDVRRARRAGLGGVIVGRALYEGQVDLQEALSC